jgi:hypothetical protein
MSRRIWSIALLAMVFWLGGATSSFAWDHGHHRHGRHHHHRHGARVFLGIGPAWGLYPGYWHYYPRHYHSYPYVYRRVVIEEPPVYVERQSAPEAGYWYYCESAGEYYPQVPRCPEPWVKVAP